MQGWRVTPRASLAYLSWHFISCWIEFTTIVALCDVHSGNTQQVPLWSWLAVKTSSPFDCLLPQDITLHPLTLDITTPQPVFWNCSREKTRCCLSLFAKFLRNTLLSSHLNSLRNPPSFCLTVMHHQSVIFNESQVLFCVWVIELILLMHSLFPKNCLVFLSSPVSNLLFPTMQFGTL